MIRALSQYIRRQRLLLALRCVIYYKALVRQQSKGGMREKCADAVIASIETLMRCEATVQTIEKTVPDAAQHIWKEKL